MKQRTVRTCALVALAALPALAAAQATPVRTASLTISAPATLAEINTSDVKGQPSRLAWSPDGTELYFQTLEGQFGRPDATLRHYLFSAANGSRTTLQGEPEWASKYWTAKSWKASADTPPLQIDLKSEPRVERTTSVPRGGDLARGGTSTATGTSDEDSMKAGFNAQTVFVTTMRLNGEIVGQWENSVIVPGLTFGWGPAGSRVIAFAAQKSGRVVVMDGEGQKREIADTKDALLPAWSPDAKRLAWLQKDGRRTLLLRVSGID